MIKIIFSIILLASFFFQLSTFGEEVPLPASKKFHLPFPPGAAYHVILGPEDPPHHLSPRNQQAYDFQMPPGAEVSAASSGVVIRSEGKFNDYTGRHQESNFIAIQHEDGLVSEYHHLLQDGVLVRAGERVEQGEVIGFSGASGGADGPHLHFVVLRGETSVPIRFEELEKKLEKGGPCRSRNVPEKFSERLRELEDIERGSELLIDAGYCQVAAILIEKALQGSEDSVTNPSQRRKSWALRQIELKLKARLKGLKEKEDGIVQVEDGRPLEPGRAN